MDFGYHHSSFRYPDEDRPMVESMADRAGWIESEGFSWFSVMALVTCPHYRNPAYLGRVPARTAPGSGAHRGI